MITINGLRPKPRYRLRHAFKTELLVSTLSLGIGVAMTVFLTNLPMK